MNDRWSAEHGVALRDLRVQRGLRQQELAEAVGQPRTVLSNWENGLRVPAHDMRERLASVLQVPAAVLDSPPAPSTPSTPDRWATLRAQLQDLVNDHGIDRLDKFAAQMALFAELADREFGWVRWQRLHAAVLPFRDDLNGVTAARAASADAAKAIGCQMASHVRTQLDLSTAPLPPLAVIAERCGVHVFRAPLAAGAAGRIRAVGAEQEPIGAAALVNAAMDRPHQTYAFAELLGRLLLHPRPATAVLAAYREKTPRRSARATVASAFAVEFVLPSEAVRRETQLADTVLGRDNGGETALDTRAAAFTSLLMTYGAPVPVTLSEVGHVWRLRAEQQRQLLAAVPASAWKRPPSQSVPSEAPAPVTAADLPPRFLAVITKTVEAGRASVEGAAQALGVDASEFQETLTSRRPGSPDDRTGWVDDPGAAVA